MFVLFSCGNPQTTSTPNNPNTTPIGQNQGTFPNTNTSSSYPPNNNLNNSFSPTTSNTLPSSSAGSSSPNTSQARGTAQRSVGQDGMCQINEQSCGTYGLIRATNRIIRGNLDFSGPFWSSDLDPTFKQVAMEQLKTDSRLKIVAIVRPMNTQRATDYLGRTCHTHILPYAGLSLEFSVKGRRESGITDRQTINVATGQCSQPLILNAPRNKEESFVVEINNVQYAYEDAFHTMRNDYCVAVDLYFSTDFTCDLQ